MNKSESLYPQTLWDHEYHDHQFELPREGDQVRIWLENAISNFPIARDAKGLLTCLEIGCFPGRYLAVMGQKGFELSGIDQTPRVTSDMPAWLKSHSFSLGEITRGDFFEYQPKHKFDVVYSVGFLEHFTDWSKVLIKHCDWVKSDGLLLIIVPNFQGWFQKLFHRIFDRENMDRHCVDSMNPYAWVPIVESQGFQVLECGYFDKLDFWIGCQRQPLLKKIIFWGIRAIKPVFKILTPRRSRAFSPYCGLIAKKLSKSDL